MTDVRVANMWQKMHAQHVKLLLHRSRKPQMFELNVEREREIFFLYWNFSLNELKQAI